MAISSCYQRKPSQHEWKSRWGRGSYLQTPSLKRHESLPWTFSLPGERGACGKVPPVTCIRKKATAKCHCICIALFFFPNSQHFWEEAAKRT